MTRIRSSLRAVCLQISATSWLSLRICVMGTALSAQRAVVQPNVLTASKLHRTGPGPGKCVGRGSGSLCLRVFINWTGGFSEFLSEVSGGY